MNFEYSGNLDKTSVRAVMGIRLEGNDKYRLYVPETNDKLILFAERILPTIEDLDLSELKGQIEGPVK